MKNLGAEIQRLRKAVGLTQEQLAENLGVTQGFVTNLETGRKSIATTKLLYSLCDALRVECGHFRPWLHEQLPPGPPAEKGKRKKPK